MLSLRLYLDDDSASPLLATLLRRAGHDPVLPSATGLSGESDPVHLTAAIETNRILLTGNHDDFEELHALILASGGHHRGIFIVRKDNDRKRDLNAHGVVQAIGKLCESALALPDTLHILNHWR